MATGVKDKIRNEISNLAGRKYDHDGFGGLPIRPDVAYFAASVLFPPFLGGISPQALEVAGEPDILMDRYGSIDLSFAVSRRELLLTILCGGVVRYAKVFEDGATSIEGILRSPWAIGKTGEDDFKHFPELNNMLFWLATGNSP